ncbi:MAG TPA: class I SAM-dependent methyltransferase, partial [Polyangiaceae bacterium]|nr:class I SAM-dependent methyltransferase [Polyangiaceae bacterium]
VLRLYDWFVLDVSCTRIWQCRAEQLLAHYEAELGAVHLDVGVGTGFFLDKARYPVERPAITLLDLNAQSLAYTAARIARYSPEVVRADVLEPNALPECRFDSIGLNFLLHCLPAGGQGKWRVFDHLKPKLAPGGRLFGSTIIGSPEPPLARQRWLMRRYNQRGIFGNASDSAAILRAELSRRFSKVEIQQKGVVALFSARD